MYSLRFEMIDVWDKGKGKGRVSTTQFFDFLFLSYQRVVYVYFIKVFFKMNPFVYFSYCQTQQLEIYSSFIFPRFDSNLVQNVNYFNTEGVNKIENITLWLFNIR
jgi:hypothetical protein